MTDQPETVFTPTVDAFCPDEHDLVWAFQNCYCDRCFHAALQRPFTPWEWDVLHHKAKKLPHHAPWPLGPYRVPADPKLPNRKSEQIKADLSAYLLKRLEEEGRTVPIGGVSTTGWKLTASDGGAALFEQAAEAGDRKWFSAPGMRPTAASVVLPPEWSLALARVAVLAPYWDRDVRLVTWECLPEGVKLTAKDPEYGEATELVPCEIPTLLHGFRIGYNAQYFHALRCRRALCWDVRQNRQGQLAQTEEAVFTLDGVTEWCLVVMPMRF